MTIFNFISSILSYVFTFIIYVFIFLVIRLNLHGCEEDEPF